MAKLPNEIRFQVARMPKECTWEMPTVLAIIVKEVEDRGISETVEANTIIESIKNQLSNIAHHLQLPWQRHKRLTLCNVYIVKNPITLHHVTV